MLLFHHPCSLAHDPAAFVPEHPDVPERIRAIEAAIAAAGGLGCAWRTAPAATVDDLALVHSSRLIERIAALSTAGGGPIDPDTWVGEASYQAALHAAGGARAMAEALLSGETATAFCLLRPAGHHAEHDRAMGFCLFNNVAVAAETAIRRLGAERVLVIDWDVHHGNGTAEIFRRRRDVLVANIHQAGIFPGTGPIGDAGSDDGLGYTINVPVPRGSDELIWLSVLEHVIIPAGREFRPQLILISAGFDAHRADPLGGCRLDTSDFAEMARQVRDLGDAVGAPVGAVLEGGYDLSSLAASVVATIRALDGEGEAGSMAPDPVVTSRAAAHVGHFWSL